MEAMKVYYCWVKLADPASADISEPAAPPAAPASRGRPPKIRAGDNSIVATFAHRPPRVVATNKRNFPSTAYPMLGGASSLGFAGSLVAGWWGLDDSFDGVRGPDMPVVRLASFLGTRDEAEDWIASDEGQVWLTGATNYFLMTFSLVSNF